MAQANAINAMTAAITAAINALPNAVQAAVQAAIQGLPAAMQAAGQPVPPVPGAFVRTPLRANLDVVLDLSSNKEHRKAYQSMTASLFPKDQKFDVEPNRFPTFMNVTGTRTRDIGLMVDGQGIALVPPDLNAPLIGPHINMIEEYGRLTLEQVRAWESTFIENNDRKSQNSKILFDMLMNTLSVTGLQRIQVWRDQYTINGNDAGLCLLKVIVRESYLDSNATVSTIRMNLTMLDDYIRKNGSDLTAFAAYVQSQVDGLAARNETTQDLVVNLFKGYKAVTYQPFLDYLQTIENAHEDGSAVVTAPMLMLRCKNFYQTKLTRDEWEQPSETDKTMLALQTKMETYHNQVKTLRKQSPKKSDQKTKNPYNKTKTKNSDEKPKWLLNHEKPKTEDMKKNRSWGGKSWHWCDKSTGGQCNGKWRVHSPSECKGFTPRDEKKPKPSKKRNLSCDALAFEILAMDLVTKVSNRIYYTLLSALVIIILMTVTLATEAEPDENDSAYRPKTKRDTIMSRLQGKVQETAKFMWTKIETTIMDMPTKRKKKQGNLRYHRITRYTSRPVQMMAMVAIAMTSTSSIVNRTSECAPFDTDSGAVGIDNRCSGCITNIRTDIPGEIRQCNRAIKGFGGEKTYNVWMGTIHWSWDDDDGRTHKMVIPNSYYVPDGKVRLLSPQHWAQTREKNDRNGGAGETTTGTHSKLFWGNQEFTRTVPILRNDNNVATFHLASGYSEFHAYCSEAGFEDARQHDENPLTTNDLDLHAEDSLVVSDTEGTEGTELQDDTFDGDDYYDATEDVVDEPRLFSLDGPPQSATPNLPNIVRDEEDAIPDNPTAELLRCHYDFGHASFKKLQEMAKIGTLPKRLAKCNVPICSACQYAKATRRPWRAKTARNWSNESKPTKPGQVVSVDQLVSPTPGLIAQMSGFLTKKRYRYATVYVDQFSSLGYVHLQKTASAEDTLEGKKAFERYAMTHGVVIYAYHADNGIFKANAWVQACQAKEQGLTFAAVGAHHTNGKAERRIRELQDMARTMLIHANKRWPEAISANLWPYALRYANETFNAIPSLKDAERRSPLQMFARTEVNINRKHWKPFGCPVYTLEEELQARKPWHKWKSRSRIGIYLGPSPLHSRNTALVLNRFTGHVSPQFHVSFDKGFYSTAQEKLISKWQEQAYFTGPLQNKEPVQSKKRKRKDEANDQSVRARDRHSEGASEGAQEQSKTSPSATEPDLQLGVEPETSTDPNAVGRSTSGTPQSGNYSQVRQSHARQQHSGEERVGAPPENIQRSSLGTRRSERRSKPIQRLIEVMEAETASANTEIPGELFCLQALFPHGAHDEPHLQHPLTAFKATSSDPDTMYLHEAMREPDREEFLKAMQKEISDQMENGNFSIVPRSGVPRNKSILPAVWSMKRKRDIKTQQVKKWKARLNIDGSRMKPGIHYDQTYSPVVSWTSIRLLLTLAAVHNWRTTQLDYVLAYPQAPVEREIYMEIPKGFEMESKSKSKKDYVLKLHRNVYGQKQAGRVWNKYLVDRLINQVGFKQSKVDECVFYRGNVIYVLYTDDSILAGPNQDDIDQAIADIKKAGLNITVEGDIQDFLGVNIERKDDGSITFSQPHLIDKILRAVRLGTDGKNRDTPAASSYILKRHADSPDFDKSFDYRSVVGMLNYLDAGSRSDISYATHQCARYTAEPKEEHAKAIRWLTRYLRGSRDKGMTFHPDPSLGLEVFVDADFAGNWDPLDTKNPDTARSRHGYIIRYLGCPITWKSQLQQEICLSSTESEYTGLSYALREVIPIMELLNEMKRYGFPVTKSKAEVHCKVFEDNSGAIEMARVHKFRPRTKHLNVKLHHFRSYVDNNRISIHAIESSKQLADYLTKPLNADTLVYLRQQVLGW